MGKFGIDDWHGGFVVTYKQGGGDWGEGGKVIISLQGWELSPRDPLPGNLQDSGAEH